VSIKKEGNGRRGQTRSGEGFCAEPHCQRRGEVVRHVLKPAWLVSRLVAEIASVVAVGSEAIILISLQTQAEQTPTKTRILH